MTWALIVVESYFGNTRAIAEAVSTGLIEGGVDAQVIDVSHSRAKACEQVGPSEASHGVGGWLETAAIPASTDAAAFDTVISKGWLSGSAAKATAKALQRHQGRRTASVRSFVVVASKGPLADGEKTDAHSWGRELADSASAR